MEGYKNPIKRNGDFADPCVIRYNGRYYLYCTNRDLRCWSSANLLDWQLEGPVIASDEFPGLVPFAPEVVYWNGSFYLYTSPHGLGHYILKSDSPTGPFYKITDNLGHNIDGSVFIDDDGQWYFYWADFTGIMGCGMKSPTELTEPVNTGAYLHGWTEGPFIMKHRGKYYMTYTGNHFLSSGYRIHAAVSEHPLGGYREDPGNPLVINTEGDPAGLGHSTTVLGPDMKSYYIVYHNLNPDKTRDLNIDLQSWHGWDTFVYGPTATEQPAPTLPDFSAYPREGQGKWLEKRGRLQPYGHGEFYQTSEGGFLCLSKGRMQPHGTAEFNLRGGGQDSGGYGVLFGWLNDENYYRLEINREDKKMRIVAAGNTAGSRAAEILAAERELPADYDDAALHCLRLQCDGDGLVVWADNRRQLEADITSIEGCIGYYTETDSIEFGFTGFSNGTPLEAEREWFKPVPGRMPVCAAFSEDKITVDQKAVSLTGGKWLSYHINAAKPGRYAINLFGSFQKKTVWRMIPDGEAVTGQTFAAAGRGILRGSVTLSEGKHNLRLLLDEGEAELEGVELKQVTEVPERITYAVDKLGPYGKRLWGDNGWCNYLLEAELTTKLREAGEAGVAEPRESGGAEMVELLEGGEVGVMFCATQPSEGGEGKDPVLGINFFRGYFVGWNKTHLILSKHAYDRKVLCRKELNFEGEEPCKVTIRVQDGTIRIYAKDEEHPVLTYHDEQPYTGGRVGVRAENGWVKGSLTVKGLEINPI